VLEGFHTDLAMTQPYTATLEIISTAVDGESVPSTISITVPNPKNGLYYNEVVPGSSPIALCSFPALETNLFKTFGFARVTPPALPVNLIMWHFFLWEPEQINRINPTDPGWADCSVWAPSEDITSPGIFSGGGCVPQMGAHWLPNKMNLFDAADMFMIWGTYNQTVNFYEPTSLDGIWTVLETAPDYEASGTYSLPRWPQQSGWYPASVRVELVDSTFTQARLSLYNFQYLWSKEDWNVALENRYLDGINDGEDRGDCNTFDDGAFGTVVQFATLVLPFLFYSL
jgi:hypothetical protein